VLLPDHLRQQWPPCRVVESTFDSTSPNRSTPRGPCKKLATARIATDARRRRCRAQVSIIGPAAGEWGEHACGGDRMRYRRCDCRPIQIHPPPDDLHVRLVHEPAITGGVPAGACRIDQQRGDRCTQR
jgi:hypothetical protein